PLLRQHVTTGLWQNTEANVIVRDIAGQYGKVTRFALAPLVHPYAQVQFPDYAVADALAAVLEPPLYAVRFDYGGNLTTAPRLGSAASGAPNLVGYPDATGPPPDELVSLTLPDGTLIEEIDSEWQDYEFVNQVRVLGRSVTESVLLGP